MHKTSVILWSPNYMCVTICYIYLIIWHRAIAPMFIRRQFIHFRIVINWNELKQNIGIACEYLILNLIIKKKTCGEKCRNVLSAVGILELND